jgi:hypothetical protein
MGVFELESDDDQAGADAEAFDRTGCRRGVRAVEGSTSAEAVDGWRRKAQGKRQKGSVYVPQEKKRPRDPLLYPNFYL